MPEPQSKYTFTGPDGETFPVQQHEIDAIDDVLPRYRPDGDPLEVLTDHDAPLDAALDRQEADDA